MRTILSLETSCDDTCASVIRDGHILSNIKACQTDFFADFGGVVPELSARLHLTNVESVVNEALKEAEVTLDDIDCIAYTVQPGLLGSLHIAAGVAKAISFEKKIPLVAVDHIEGHILSGFINNNKSVPNKFISLVVSGGTSSLYLTDEKLTHHLLGKKIDDAVGEAFDKVAKMMGLRYPGGPEVDALSKNGQPIIRMPKIKTEGYNYSFSGIKSAVKNYIDKNPNYSKEDLSSSFQKAAIDHLLDKLLLAANEHETKHIVISGGVSSNSYLRERVEKEFSNFGLFITDLKYTTDNAAMIANAVDIRFNIGAVKYADLETASDSRTKIGEYNE